MAAVKIHPANKPCQVAVVYRLDHPGGVQSVAFSIIRGLNRIGIVPDLLWDLEPDWTMLKRNNLQVNFNKIRFTVPTTLIDRLPVSIRYLAWAMNEVKGEMLKKKYDFYYIFFNGFLPPENIPHIRYLSGPPLVPQLMNTRKGWVGLPGRFSYWFYQKIMSRFSSVYHFHRNSHYVINSHFTAGLFEAAYGTRLPVIHPPIDLSGRHFDFNDIHQRDTITYFSRFINYKRPEKVLQLAARHPDHKFLLMGAVAKQRQAYYESLKEKARQDGLQNVTFLANPPNHQVREMLAKTRFFVFPARNEHFGMTTVEAIASGAVPFVHNSGGQIEIVPNPDLRFSDTEFFAKFSALLNCSDEELNIERRQLLQHVQQYTEENFIEKMLSFIPECY